MTQANQPPANPGRFSYAEGLIEKAESEPPIAELRRRVAGLKAEAGALRAAEEQAGTLQLIIGKLGLFAEMVRDRLEAADRSTQRDIICTPVKRIEVAADAVRVVFRVDPGPSGSPRPRRSLPHCPTRRRAPQHVALGRGVPLEEPGRRRRLTAAGRPPWIRPARADAGPARDGGGPRASVFLASPAAARPGTPPTR